MYEQVLFDFCYKRRFEKSKQSQAPYINIHTTTVNITKSDKITKNKEKGKEEDKHGGKYQEKWATFTYCRKEVKYSAKLYKGTYIKKSIQIQ